MTAILVGIDITSLNFFALTIALPAEQRTVVSLITL
jgi:hypothetical protein